MVRRTVTDYVLYPCRRSSEPLPASGGELVTGMDGAGVQVLAEVAAGRVAAFTYRASSCATLVAYAEVLGELVVGLRPAEAMQITPERLIAALAGVPVYRQERAVLVARAWWSALARCLESNSNSMDPEGERQP